MFKQADLLKLAESNGIKIEKHRLPAGIKSIYTELKECPIIICLNKQLTSPECTVELAVCLGFYFTRSENNPSSSEKRTKAEDWAYTHLVPVETFTQRLPQGGDIAGIANMLQLTRIYTQSRPILRRAAGVIYYHWLLLRNFRAS